MNRVDVLYPVFAASVKGLLDCRQDSLDGRAAAMDLYPVSRYGETVVIPDYDVTRVTSIVYHP